MASISSALAVNRDRALGSTGWLVNRNWDMTFLILSSAVVVLPYMAYSVLNGVLPSLGIANENFDVSRNIINAIVGGLVGGPHMYATYTRTLMDPEFREKHRAFFLSSFLIPAIVIFMAFDISRFSILLTLFFTWASIHVIHQATYIVDCYRRRQPSRRELLPGAGRRWQAWIAGLPVSLRIPLGKLPSWMPRLIDYGLVFSAMYPMALRKMLTQAPCRPPNPATICTNLQIGSNDLGALFVRIFGEQFFHMQWLYSLSLVGFALAIGAFVVKTALEIRAGQVHWPKTVFIALTAIGGFIVPTFDNLDVAFQGFNTWHSFQYLGLTWYINRLRDEKRPIRSKLVHRLSERDGRLRFYLFTLGCTIFAAVASYFLFQNRDGIGLSMTPSQAFDQSYYMVVLSFLWIHYYHDHFLFTQPEAALA